MKLFKYSSARLIICVVILLAALALRLLWPKGAEAAARAMAPVLWESVNMGEALEVLGGAFRGEVPPEEALSVFFPSVD